MSGDNSPNMSVTSVHNIAPSRPTSPLSLRTISNLLNQFPHEDAETMWVIAQGLLSTIQRHKIEHFAEKNRMQSNVKHLEENILNLTANWNTCSEGYEENGDKVPGFVIPVGEGLYRLAKWIKQVETEKVAGYADVQGPRDAPYITEIFVSSDFSVETPYEPIAPWLRNILKGNASQFAMLLEAVEELGDWGISTDVRHYREFDDQVIYLRNQINKIEQDLACITEMRQLAEFRLEAARLNHHVGHLQGLAGRPFHPQLAQRGRRCSFHPRHTSFEDNE